MSLSSLQLPSLVICALLMDSLDSTIHLVSSHFHLFSPSGLFVAFAASFNAVGHLLELYFGHLFFLLFLSLATSFIVFIGRFCFSGATCWAIVVSIVFLNH